MLTLPRVVAHRGASAEAPENTLVAFRRAIDVGCRAIELDVQLTSDGHPVVMHDDVLDRTTNGTGPVSACSLEEVRRLDAGAWFGREFAGERVPTLGEALDLAREAGAFVNVEIKTDRHPYPGIEEAVAEAVLARGLVNRVFVSSFNPATVKRFHAVLPAVGTGVIHLGEPLAEEIAAYAKFARALGLYVECATPEAVAMAHEAKMSAIAWVVNDAALARQLFDAGVDGVITDDPRALREFL